MSATAREIDVYLVYYFTPFRPVLSIGFEGKLKIQIPARRRRDCGGLANQNSKLEIIKDAELFFSA